MSRRVGAGVGGAVGAVVKIVMEVAGGGAGVGAVVRHSDGGGGEGSRGVGRAG